MEYKYEKYMLFKSIIKINIQKPQLNGIWRPAWVVLTL